MIKTCFVKERALDFLRALLIFRFPHPHPHPKELFKPYYLYCINIVLLFTESWIIRHVGAVGTVYIWYYIMPVFRVLTRESVLQLDCCRDTWTNLCGQRTETLCQHSGCQVGYWFIWYESIWILLKACVSPCSPKFKIT